MKANVVHSKNKIRVDQANLAKIPKSLAAVFRTRTTYASPILSTT